MSDIRTVEPLDLSAAMRRLPLPTPPGDGWPAMQARLHARRRRHWRQRLGMALAASIALAVLTGLLMDQATAPPDPSATAPAPIADSESARHRLIEQSAQLEALLAWSGPTWVETGDVAALDQRLAERLNWIDLQLADAAADPDSELLLWSERVALLRQRAELANADLLLAERESAGTAALVL